MACIVNKIPAGLDPQTNSLGTPTLKPKPQGIGESLLEDLGDTSVTTVGHRNTAVTTAEGGPLERESRAYQLPQFHRGP